MRLATGGRIDRSKPLNFSFDRRPYQAFPGDTLASALLANSVHLTGRSFKYHRPRGILAAGVEEPNALVGVDRGPGRFEPNQRATVVPLVEGLRAESQNRWPSLRFDAGAVNDLAAPLIPAGFYYKTFLWPRKAWAKFYEPRIRAAAGLGRPPSDPDSDRYTELWAHAELLIIGAGPAGLAAALSAAPSGQRIILCDDQEEMGGWLLSAPGAMIDGLPAWDWLADALARLASFGNVTLLPRTTAFSYGPDNLITLAERLTDHRVPAEARGARERLWLVRAGRTVLAAGAIERPIPFSDNDRPGIMLASAVETYVARYGVLPGERIVACVDHDSGYGAALVAQAAGAAVTIADSRTAPSESLVEQTRAAGIEVLPGTVPTGSCGRLRVSALELGERSLPCDLVLMAGGWTPSLHLFSQARGKVLWSEEAQAFLPGEAGQAVVQANGLTLDGALASGWAAGGGSGDRPRAAFEPEPAPARIAAYRHKSRAFVDFQNDVTTKDIALAAREGFESIEHIKRYTTSGMATDQGKTSNMNALAVAASVLERPIPQVGLTTFRSPYTPTTFGALAGLSTGKLFDPVRLTPSHGWAAARGAVFEDVGQWKRARYFPKGCEPMREAVHRECLAVRSCAGVFDASTLGKIEVVGPDAAEFLKRMYTGGFAKLGVGKCRYGVLLREDGYIMDDGVIARIAPDRFHVTTTTGGAANVLNMMEDYRQTEFPDLTVWLTSTTEEWATIAVQGPRAREIVGPLVEGIDMAGEAFPHMSWKAGYILGAETRLWRVSFTGELGYEINVPSSEGARIWEAVADAGEQIGATVYGTETMHVLRAEKGYIIVGQETDGTVTPDDAGLGWAVSKVKPDFVGKRSLARPALSEPDRKQLVGLLSDQLLEEGAQIIDPAAPAKALGHVTSAYRSAALGRPIALALIRRGRARLGERLAVHEPRVAVELVEPVFYDKGGERLNA